MQVMELKGQMQRHLPSAGKSGLSAVVTVAQLVEPLTVTQVVVGSSPISHPNFLLHFHFHPPVFCT
jgi:hypothetical protein